MLTIRLLVREHRVQKMHRSRSKDTETVEEAVMNFPDDRLHEGDDKDEHERASEISVCQGLGVACPCEWIEYSECLGRDVCEIDAEFFQQRELYFITDDGCLFKMLYV
uniref:Uncharacterized protein n=1 Tax=Paramoeba aestuarina TaxID=180227 RepID=A0A7S4L7L5_9EUKA|mmetsp:Transcript_32785/g.51241  ORF Transcript_32785/g.51241 Transcript_32785/m.51241 type:complete len:108 (+) Transcript_32785:282-605(+)